MKLEILNSNDDKIFLILGAISCGVPIGVTGEITPVKLLEYLTGNSGGVFALRACGDSMFPDIESGDVVIVDSNRQAKFGEKIIALVRGEYTLKTYKNSGNGLRLVASNGKYKARKITKRDEFEIVGVVSHVIKKI